ncbi:helix-turn-helix domain-containing protein [Streptomyces tirandamycinicus]|uniref:helix-turn-helix domain-containing protein n=1 Tax=Streptomyces TaxID=1883 RepID=UPI0003A949CA|nr:MULTISPECIES: helix-turn-helix domain-containing protein [Streptomyces]MCY0985197.1 helix-turn-helix domain-containing protein [Streptomyces tirandamycinicus]
MSHPPEVRRQALDLLAEGEPVKKVAVDLGLSERTLYQWRRRYLPPARHQRYLPDAGTELGSARRRIAELEAEVAVLRRASELLRDGLSPKDGSRQYA